MEVQKLKKTLGDVDNMPKIDKFQEQFMKNTEVDLMNELKRKPIVKLVPDMKRSVTPKTRTKTKMERESSKKKNKSALNSPKMNHELVNYSQSIKRMIQKVKNQKADDLSQSKFFGNIFGELSQEGPRAEEKEAEQIHLIRSKKTSQKDFSRLEDDEELSVKSMEGGELRKSRESRRAEDTTAPKRSAEKNVSWFDISSANELSNEAVPLSTKERFLSSLFKLSSLLKSNLHQKNAYSYLVTSLPLKNFRNMLLIYKLSALRGKPTASSFHASCDGRGPYLGLISTTNSLFGFYVGAHFADEFEVYTSCPESFIFSMQSQSSSKFFKFKVKRGKENFALCNTEDGFCLGMPTPHNRDLYLK